ncbi:MAG TPA: hypothetical protein VFO05_04685 [Candidatus Limnocylindrales bacterium]|nr:hypothetical protein [Candidatus Limnocylindrales bacterium]
MPDALDDVLRLVAEGRLTAEEAAPVIDALEEAMAAAKAAGISLDDDATTTADGASPRPGSPSRPSALRLEVSEGGRKVVNLRVPLSLGRAALDRIPGLSIGDVSSIRDALDAGITGPILAVDEDDDGNGVRIVLE